MGATSAFLVAAGRLVGVAAAGEPSKAEAVQQLPRRAESSERIRVIIGVGLDKPIRPEGVYGEESRHLRREHAPPSHRIVVARWPPFSVGKLAGGFKFKPYIVTKVDAVALRELMDSPLPAATHEKSAHEPLLAGGAPQIGANFAWSASITGAGWTIAVLNTGVNKTPPFLAGAVVSEACFSSNDASTPLSPCP